MFEFTTWGGKKKSKVWRKEEMGKVEKRKKRGQWFVEGRKL